MIYIAGPFFDEQELNILQQVESILQQRGLEIHSPRLHEDQEHEFQTAEWSQTTFELDRDAIDQCDIVVAVYHGNYSDTGTAWECGYAYAHGKPVIVVHVGDSSNLMVHESARANISLEELRTYDFQEMRAARYTGKMY